MNAVLQHEHRSASGANGAVRFRAAVIRWQAPVRVHDGQDTSALSSRRGGFSRRFTGSDAGFHVEPPCCTTGGRSGVRLFPRIGWCADPNAISEERRWSLTGADLRAFTINQGIDQSAFQGRTDVPPDHDFEASTVAVVDTEQHTTRGFGSDQNPVGVFQNAVG